MKQAEDRRRRRSCCKLEQDQCARGQGCRRWPKSQQAQVCVTESRQRMQLSPHPLKGAVRSVVGRQGPLTDDLEKEKE